MYRLKKKHYKRGISTKGYGIILGFTIDCVQTLLNAMTLGNDL